MKKSPLKSLYLSILLSITVLTAVAQSQSHKDFYLNLEDELDLFATDSTLGEKIWGLAALSVSNMRSDPKHASELVSQVTMGTPVKLIEETVGWIRVETPEGYNGWIDTCGLVRLSPEEIDQWKNADRYVFKQLIGYAFDAPSQKGKIVTDLVLNDIFIAVETKIGFLKIRLPDGRTGYVRKKDCISWNDWINKTPEVQSILSVARQMMGSPYLWGGTSAKGVDCSGLVKITFLSQAIVLERDASQQAQFGESIDFSDFNNLQAGDLLFFGMSPEKISHVGIYLSKGDYIHSSGLVHINNIDPNNPNYNFASKKHLVAVKRIFNSLNSEGIVGVKYHPWYNDPFIP